MILAHVAYPSADVKHRGGAATEDGGHRPLVKGGIVERSVVEGGEKPHQVTGIVDSGSIKQD